MQALMLAAVASLAGPAVADPAPAPPAPPAAAASTAAPAKNDVATLLFDLPQWNGAPIATQLTYRYLKKVEAVYGPSFDDQISLKLEKGDDDKSRTVDVTMFSGPNAKPAGPFRSTAQNPVILIALEANVDDLSKAWSANSRFMKKAIRQAWRDSAKVEKTQIEVAGKSVPGTRITIEPYKDSPEKAKMQGLETMVYAIEIADAVPGEIAKVDIHAPATGPLTFNEVLTFASATKP